MKKCNDLWVIKGCDFILLIILEMYGHEVNCGSIN